MHRTFYGMVGWWLVVSLVLSCRVCCGGLFSSTNKTNLQPTIVKANGQFLQVFVYGNSSTDADYGTIGCEFFSKQSRCFSVTCWSVVSNDTFNTVSCDTRHSKFPRIGALTSCCRRQRHYRHCTLSFEGAKFFWTEMSNVGNDDQRAS